MTTPTPTPTPTDRTALALVRRVLAAPVRVRTYKSLLYLLLTFPLGVAYFVWLTTGTAVGLGLLVTVIGLPVLIVTLSGAVAAAGIEARLARWLVGVDASVPAFLRAFDASEGLTLPGDGFVDAIRRLITAPATWIGVVLLVTKFVSGIVSVVAVTVAVGITTALLAAPFVYDGSIPFVVGPPARAGEYTIGSWTISTLPEALAVAGAGVLFGVLALNALNALAYTQAAFTKTLLGASRPGSSR